MTNPRLSARYLPILLATALLLLLAPLAHAQKLSPPIVGLISIQEVFARSVAWNQAVMHLQEQQGKMQAEQQRQQALLEEQAQKIEQNRPLLSAEAYAAQRQQFAQQRNAVQNQLNQRAQSFQRLELGLRQLLLQQLEVAVRNVSGPKGIDMVIAASQQGNVLLITPEYDISIEAIDELNKLFKSFPLAELRQI